MFLHFFLSKVQTNISSEYNPELYFFSVGRNSLTFLVFVSAQILGSI